MASEFSKHLKGGVFKVPVCTVCGKTTWPPLLICPVCYSATALKEVDTNGVIIEFSISHVKGHEGAFGIVELDGLRLVASFDSAELRDGMRVRMADCGIRDGTPYYLFVPEK